jgi:hypothetical protein
VFETRLPEDLEMRTEPCREALASSTELVRSSAFVSPRIVGQWHP